MNFNDSDRRQDKLTVRRSLLLVLAVMAVFVALTKIFPDTPAPHTQPLSSTGIAVPSH